MQNKLCKRCDTEKPVDNFVSQRGTKDGFHPWCKPCRAGYYKAYDRSGRKPNDPAKQRVRYLRTYGLTPESYETLLNRQSGKCLGCGLLASDSTRTFHIDHDHSCCPGAGSCGACVRGILCSNCNSALGMVRDSKETLLALHSYLSNFTKP